MKIEEVKEYYKDAKIVESHEGVKFEIKNMDYIDNGLGCSKHCYYYSNMTIYLPNKGFAKIIEYKTKATQITVGDKNSTVDDWLKSTFTVDVPNGMEIDRNSIKFKKIEKQLPNSWEEFVTDIEKTDTQFGFEFCQSWRRLNLPEDLKAMQQLRLLRDCYNDGWKADWSKDYGKYVIFRHKKGLETTETPFCVAFLNFKTAELRDKFLENFKDIIEIAKPLL